MPPNDNNPRVIVSGTLLAHNFTDGTAVLTGGKISASSLNLRGSLMGKDATFVGLTAEDTYVQNITSDSSNLRNLDVDHLVVSEDASFSANVSVNGSLTAGATTLNQTNVMDLTSKGDTNIEGLLMAHSNIQVTADVNVGGSAKFMSDVFANMTATVQRDLTVTGDAGSMSLFVGGTTTATSVHVKEMTRVSTLNITGNAEFGANLNLQSDLMVGGGANFKQSLSANDANITTNLQVGMNATIRGDITSGNAQFGNLTIAKDSTVGVNLTTGGKIAVNGSATVAGSATVGGDIMASAMVKAVNGDFATLEVDTATIVALTSTFVSASTVNSADATVSGMFMVNGPSTVDSLTVKSSSNLNGVNAQSFITTTLNADSTTAVMLTVTGHTSLDTMHVKTMLVSGRPTESSGWFASFESAFADRFEAYETQAANGEVVTIVGDSANFHNITGVTGEWDNSWSQMAEIKDAMVTSGYVSMLWGDEATITDLTAGSIFANLINATGTSTVDYLSSANLTTDTLQSMTGTIGWDWSTTIQTDNVNATNGTLDNLQSSSASITWEWSVNGTVTTLTAEQAWFKNVTGENLAFTNGNITMLRTMDFSNTLMYNATQGASGDWVNSQVAKLGTTEARTLYVTGDGWLSNSTFRGDTQVYGFSTFEDGFISGEAVLGSLTVVQDASFSDISVTGPAFLTDLWVKRVTISDSFQASSATLVNANTTLLTTTGDANFTGVFTVPTMDSLLRGNLVVSGTTQFQTGSFSRIGTALITTTEMEAFNMDVANGLFGAITVDDLTVTRGAVFDRSIQLAPMIDSTSGSDFSFFTSIVPSVLIGNANNQPFFVNGQTIFHSGQATVDQLVITTPDDPTRVALRITGDGQVDFVESSFFFRNLEVSNGVSFDNEQNLAFPPLTVTTTRTLAMGVSNNWFTYSDLIDRDGGLAGAWIDPAPFVQPANATDLLTLQNGQYRVSGSVKFATSTVSDKDAVVVTMAGVDAFSGTSSAGQTATWSTECVANFGLVSGARTVGSCYFSGIVTVPAGSVFTLRSKADWSYSSTAVATAITVDPSSTLVVEELFERTSENLN